MPGLITDLVLSLDDRWLYFANWLHGDIRQYDVSDPSHPNWPPRPGSAACWAKEKRWQADCSPADRRCCSSASTASGCTSPIRSTAVGTTSSIRRSAKGGSYLLQLDCDTRTGGTDRQRKFLVDFGKEPGGPARAHEIRFPGGDSTSDIWV